MGVLLGVAMHWRAGRWTRPKQTARVVGVPVYRIARLLTSSRWPDMWPGAARLRGTTLGAFYARA